MMSKALLKFQIGPVQDFIAAARSTRDLWSGSYLLSYLVAKGLRELLKPEHASELIFPNPAIQPLLKQLSEWPQQDQKALLTPNLPNLFVARVPADSGKATAIAKAVQDAIKDQWQAIAIAVWKQHAALNIPATSETAFNNAVNKHLSISWQITPIGERGYTEAYRDNGWHLDAVRQTRDFVAWGSGAWTLGHEKDSLTGKEESLCGGTDFQKQMQKKGGEIPSLFKHSDHVGPITFIKRVWHLAYLRDKGLKTGSREFIIRSIPAIAARREELDDERDTDPTAGGDKYIAAIAFDGDYIGKWVDGKELENPGELRQHHTAFSAALSDFALNKVRAIVEDEHAGQLIYAGGDDVVALVPSDTALECASALRQAFCEATKEISGKNEKGEVIHPDASAGIAIAHIHAPLQDLIREAQKAEKRAKNTVGRPAFSITLMKRSGEISEWGAKWEFGGLALYQQIAVLLDLGKLTGKFPHRVCQLLTPYLSRQADLADPADPADQTDLSAVITREFAFAVSRQSTAALTPKDRDDLTTALATYLGNLHTLAQTQLTALIGLCTTVAFTHRTRPESTTPKGNSPA